MVSFQCDGCQDVVKKPKLDNHSSRCHASFTCIDCSKTFAGSAQWKTHTSCISEEQKYHKSVYQDPRGRGRGRGQRGRGGARGGFTRAPYTGSGENSIPLGGQANGWTAPPPDPVNNTPFDSTEWTATTTEPTPTPHADATEADSKKSKKSKKRKTEEGDSEAATVTPAADEPAKKKKKGGPLVPESTTEPVADKQEKKKKRSRKSELVDEDGDVAVTEAASITNGKEKKSKKSRKYEEDTLAANGDSSHSIPDSSAPAPTNESPKKKKKSRKSEDVAEEPTLGVETVINGDNVEKKHKKGKKLKGDNPNGVAAPQDPPKSTSNPNTDDLIPISVIESSKGLTKKEKEKEKKKQAKAKAKEALSASGAPIHQDAIQPATKPTETESPRNTEKSKKKEKKEKLQAVEASVENGEPPQKRKSKSKSETGDVTEDTPKVKKMSKREKKAKEATVVA